MPYESLCVSCGYFVYASSRRLAEDLIWQHKRRSGCKGWPATRRISKERYEAHLLLKDDPRYWHAIRNGRHLKGSCGIRNGRHLKGSCGGEAQSEEYSPVF